MAQSARRHRIAALWFIFCTLLSTFNICTIQIFDGPGWPFYAVTLNAVVSILGIIYHMHVDESRTKVKGLVRVIPHVVFVLNSLMVFPMLFLGPFTLSGEYHSDLTADAMVTSTDQIWQTVDASDKDVALLETDDLYILRRLRPSRLRHRRQALTR